MSASRRLVKPGGRSNSESQTAATASVRTCRIMKNNVAIEGTLLSTCRNLQEPVETCRNLVSGTVELQVAAELAVTHVNSCFDRSTQCGRYSSARAKQTSRPLGCDNIDFASTVCLMLLRPQADWTQSNPLRLSSLPAALPFQKKILSFVQSGPLCGPLSTITGPLDHWTTASLDHISVCTAAF